jgi:EAL domain-containing protein (putative c-di-GMP-specific phosphodiesterase class I)
MWANVADASIVTSTIELAANLGIGSVAEGVESEAVYNRLEQLGCDVAQGYWIKPPAPGSEITEWLRHSPWASTPLPLPGATS